MGIENRIVTGNIFASNARLSGFSSVSTPSNKTNKFPARVIRIVSHSDYIIEFEPIIDNLNISAFYNKNVITNKAKPKSNQLISLPDINSIVIITVEPGMDVSKKSGGAGTCYWELPTNIQNTRNENIGPKDKPKPPSDKKQILSYKQAVLGIPNQNG